MREAAPKRPLSTPELVAMVATLSALNALAIDIMLPALPDIGRAFGLTNDNDRQLVVVAYIALFGVSQLVYGPLADAFGRRSVLISALGIYILGSVLCVVAPTFELFLAARALQGLGAGATRVIAVTVVRDLTEGRRMAQVMSMAMTIFMVVPIVAPSIGQLILFVAPWRWIFGGLLLYALAITAWSMWRLPETLRHENRTPFRPGAILAAYATVLSNRQMVGYMIATVFITAALFAYITAAEQIFVDVYDLGAAFPIAFGAIAISISIGTFLNSRIVVRHGMRRISHTMTLWFTAMGFVFTALTLTTGVSFLAFMVLLALTFSVIGLTSSNFNALAMEPMGRVAGSASAVFGAMTSAGGAALGALIARAFDGTVGPFALGLFLAGLATLGAVLWTERGRLTLKA
ncbi:multidrug effflux MFS transporter [Terricaulis silvestris]|uniref:Bcr/CflA family efflux transporter n=1 Tax=Terricaulis silvestris TaxID=2686094 RepID=A0A6I6MJT3_9CAUL|nr:multidrug effflux MFS transporter [Terricaulis silvestris]QGZ94161.1 Sulfonamide resistance protein [Terricaulis silvestris]